MPCATNTSEDNPTWYTFAPSGKTFSINVSTSGCTGGPGSIQVTFFEGDDCGSVTAIAIACLNCITSGSLSVPTTPCKQYWIQIDGCAEAVCNFTFTYDPKELLSTAPQPIVSGPKTSCVGESKEYCAFMPDGCKPSDFKWTVVPNGNATITQNDTTSCVSVKWSFSGNYKLCAQPKFNIKCPPQNVQTTCIDVKVEGLGIDVDCNVTDISCDKIPLTYNLLPCLLAKYPNLDTNITPKKFIINTPCGTSKSFNIPIQIPGQKCSSSVNLKTSVCQKLVIGKATISTFAGVPKTVSLKPLILAANPNFVGNPVPSKIVLNEKPGTYLKKIKYTIEGTQCTGEVWITFFSIKKGFFAKQEKAQNEINPDGEIIESVENTSKPIINISTVSPEGLFYKLEVTNYTGDYEVAIFNTSGQTILEEKNLQDIDLQRFTSGIYLVKVTGKDWTETLKLSRN